MNQGQKTRGDMIFFRIVVICGLIVVLINLAECLFFGEEWTTRRIFDIVFWAGFTTVFLLRGFAPSKTRISDL